MSIERDGDAPEKLHYENRFPRGARRSERATTAAHATRGTNYGGAKRLRLRVQTKSKIKPFGSFGAIIRKF